VPPGLTDFTLVHSRLEEYKAATMAAMAAYFPDHEPRRHLYDLVPSYPNRPGKGFRCGLCLATCNAVGGETKSALRSAVAIELFHNAFLIHDDVEDGSEFRRGLPTMCHEHGDAIAVNVGDAMNVLSIRPLMDNLTILGPNLTWRVFSEIEHMVRQSVEGQAMEIGWVVDNVLDLTEDDYLRMTLKKTCYYTCIHPCRIGALIGSGATLDLARFDRFGYYMGAAFQIQDDILNLTGDTAKYGKEAKGDIWEGKRTLMLIHLFRTASTPDRDRLHAFLATPRQERQTSDVMWVFEMMLEKGSLDHARSVAHQLAGAALREFFVAYGSLPESTDKSFVQAIVLYMIHRDL
jgi:geranylgeranyl diphosphate synthase type II